MRKEKLFKKLLILFILIQPILDLACFYGNISTLIRVLFISFFFLITILHEKNKKIIFGFIFYFLIATCFFFMHDFHAQNFYSLAPNDFYYSTFEEMLYFIKMLMPMMLIYVVYRQCLNDKEINFIVKILVLVISGSIILTNLFEISLSSYSMNYIKGNFFDWFTNDYNFSELASKGWFYFANHIIAILMLLLPLTFNYFVKENKKIGFALLFIIMFSLLLLGNKTSVFGSYLVFLVMFIVYLIACKLTTRKENYSYNKYKVIFCVLILVIFPFFMYYSPAYERVATSEGTKTEYESSINQKKDSLTYIENNYKDKNISKDFITKYYPYKYDPEFWIRIMKEPENKRINYRYLEIEIAKRVMEINDSKLDKFFGMGYSRLMNIFNIERDYINQYYAIGIFGIIIFIFPYVALLLLGIIYIFKNKIFDFSLFSLFMSLLLFLFIAYLSGNLLNSLFCMVIFAFFLGFYLQKIKNT